MSSLVIVGGGVRVPKVQSILKDYVGDKLAQNVNGDEAAVLGGAFRGASLSSFFRVKEIRLKDVLPFAAEITYPGDSYGIGKSLQ